MPIGNLTLRLSSAGQIFVAKNRRLSQPWRWSLHLVGAMALVTVGLLLISLCFYWSDCQHVQQSYQISLAQDTQKQYLEINRKLKIELANLTAIARLEKLAEQYEMKAPRPDQVVTLK